MARMKNALVTGIAVVGLAATGLGLAGASGAEAANCVRKAASGTNSTADGAKFQAWEAVLQATDWGSWASFMSSGGKIGSAPGYKVSNVSSKCGPGGIGYSCKMQATLCK
jgi:hypothetical protein